MAFAIPARTARPAQVTASVVQAVEAATLVLREDVTASVTPKKTEQTVQTAGQATAVVTVSARAMKTITIAPLTAL